MNVINKKLDTQILAKFLKLTAERLGTCIVSEGELQFNCNICGDSERKSKLRGHLKRSDNEEYWFYKCFNAGCPASDTWSAKKWLKDTDISCYKLYCKESLEYSDVKTKNANTTYQTKVAPPVPKKYPEYEQYAKYFKPIDYSDDLIYRKAIYQCQQRNIPEHIYKKFLVCPFVPYDDKEFRGYQDRMIIPFYDNNDRIYYFQGRTLSGRDPKYLNMKGRKETAMYNLYNVDNTKPIIVTEGPIDSMFVDNAISTLGVDHSKPMKKILNKLDCYYLFDNDKAGKLEAKRHHQKGHKVFIWEKFKYYNKNHKDINDVINNNDVKHFSFEDLESCFDNSYSDYRYYLGKC